MTTPDPDHGVVDALYAAAERASEGPWLADGTDAFTDGGEIHATVLGGERLDLIVTLPTGVFALTEAEYTKEGHAERWHEAGASQAVLDAAYIAAASPDRVRALIDRLRAVEAAAQAVMDEWDELGPTGTSVTVGVFGALRAALRSRP